MAFQKKCPLCSAKMSKVNGVLTCPDCGYNESFSHSSYTTSDSGETTSTAANTSQSSRSLYQNAQNSGSIQAGGQQSSQGSLRPYEQYLNQQNGNAASAPSFAEITAKRQALYGNERKKSTSGILILCFVLIILFIIILFLVLSSFFGASRHKNNSHSSKSDTESTNRAGSGHYSTDTDDSGKGLALEKATLPVPQSEFFSQMMCLIFDKESDELSASDSEQIVSLHVYEVGYDYLAVDYVLADGTEGTVYPASQSPDVEKDLTCFVNLEALYLEEHSYGDLNLDGLEKLHTIYYDDYISDIENAISPEQITELGLYDVHFSASGLSAFTNVESLYLDSTMLTDISGISELPNLKKLTIMDADYIDDLSALYQATQLESLYIESNALRDVSFLTKFDNLTELTIIGSKVLDFTPLAECTGLESLYLLKNYETTDYAFVNGLTGLKEFGLMTSFDFDDSDMPDLSALSNVTKLYLGKYESFDNLKYMTNVEELIIDDGGYGDFGSNNSLLQLPNLRSLTLKNSSVSPEMIQQISEVEGLEYLDLYSSYLWSDISPIFNLPNLQELYLNYASFMLNTDAVAENEHLRVLDMGNAVVYKNNADQWANKENIDVKRLQEALTNLHGMEELTLEDLTMDSVDFAGGMGNLKMLNITDNYVTSLAPLANLPKLQVIVCETNPISDTAGLDDILVK